MRKCFSNTRVFSAIILLILLIACSGKRNLNVKSELNVAESVGRQARFMFYNVENLFDIYDDSLKNDNEFLPYGAKHWNSSKFNNKIKGIYKVIMGIYARC